MARGLRVFGHPLHAALSHVPMGLLGTALLWDCLGAWRGEAVWWAVSYWGVAAGLAAACVAATAGAVDYAAIEQGDPALDTGNRHLLFVLCALVPYFLGMFARGGPEGPRGRAVLAVLLLDAAGALLLSIGGWYGGHMVFHHGVGVDAPRKEPSGQVAGRAGRVPEYTSTSETAAGRPTARAAGEERSAK